MTGLERKAVDLSYLKVVDEGAGVAEAIVSSTNVPDHGDDIIIPGAYQDTLTRRRPKCCWGHDWKTSVGKTLEIEELLPGSTRLPLELLAKGAGALWVVTQFNLKTQRGAEAYADVVFWGPEGEWSIGYDASPPEGKAYMRKDGLRALERLALYEYSPVLFGMAPGTSTLSMKRLAAVERFLGKDASDFDRMPVDERVAVLREAKDALGQMLERNLAIQQADEDADTEEFPDTPSPLAKSATDGTDEGEEPEEKRFVTADEAREATGPVPANGGPIAPVSDPGRRQERIVAGARMLGARKARMTFEPDLQLKRNYSQAEREEMAKNGEALPNGSYPIKNGADLQHAISLVGMGNDSQPEIRQHIIARARALGLTDKLPASWHVDGTKKTMRARPFVPQAPVRRIP